MEDLIKNKLTSQLVNWAVGFGLAFGLWFAAPASASAATLGLTPASGSVASGSTLEVKIQLDTGGATTSGTDAYIRFDPSVFQVVDSVPGTDGTQILAGSLYSQTSYNSVDNSVGKISFSGSKSGGSPGYSGSGTLATITLQAVKEATASAVSFDFTQGSTTDSNVIDQSSSDDVLASVANGSYTVGAASATDTTAPTTTTTTTTTDNTQGQGTGTVQGTGIELNGYLTATILSLVGAGFFLTRRPKH